MKVNKKILVRALAVILGYALITVLLKSGMLNRQYTSLLVPIGVNIMLAVSLNLVTGFLGELSLGHAGFMSIGAYAGALFTLHTDLPDGLNIIVAMIVGGLMAALFGFVIGVPVLRLQGDYLAIVTLAFGEIIKSVLNALKFTNGPKGLSKIPLLSNYQHYTLVFVVMVITVLIITNIVDSRHGRAVCSVRDNYIAAESIGISVSRFKIMAFVIGAFFAGVAGVLYAHNVGIIKPTTFDYNKSIEILVIVVLGGMGSIRGSIISAIILTVLPEVLRGADNMRMLLYSIVLIAMMLFNQSGFKERMMERIAASKQQKAGE
ncbi:MAG: branched-chain amino acid ABC transporter permease [Lachnospiraceae bacterium]|nr:branched-chain amino acid ABC transporter permease [Lachnospiraceae bacterium]MDD7024040.1 branched-chain amino acid ABC transporter permease [Oscillospiraceae bacterium]MDY5541251.1 branched-chain amino acid ABC transporter permease [Lachnospiraceae bacterium]MDY5648000.1 branched-chain amino acid ABC transporter permease [Lachnospiraceae bacterium]